MSGELDIIKTFPEPFQARLEELWRTVLDDNAAAIEAARRGTGEARRIAWEWCLDDFRRRATEELRRFRAALRAGRPEGDAPGPRGGG